MGRKEEVLELAYWFVTEVLGREWTPADSCGSHVAHAKKLLKLGYDPVDIKACIMAIKNNTFDFKGLHPDFELKYLTAILKANVVYPYIEQFLRR